MLIVIAEMVAKPGLEERLKNEVLALIAPTRKEQGCGQYDLHQHTDDPARFVFYETWASRADLDRHLETPHLRAFLGVAAELLLEPPRIMTYSRIA